jgi:hypothetical protein
MADLDPDLAGLDLEALDPTPDVHSLFSYYKCANCQQPHVLLTCGVQLHSSAVELEAQLQSTTTTR